jgi:hypothetical protein
MTETRLRLVDFASGESTDLGRVGAGPREFQRPHALFAGAGDTTRMLDLNGRRLLTIGPDGRLTDHESRLGMVSGGFKPPRGMDDQGRIYFDLSGILTAGLERSAALGQAHVLRLDPRTSTIDTVAAIRVPPMSMTGNAQSGPVPPYQPEDAWAVDRAGRVAVVRHDPYRVEWFSPGQPTVAGPAVAFEPVSIGRAEREAWLDRITAGAGIVVTQNGQSRTLRPPRPDADALAWPRAMPPFDGPAWITGQGEVWIRRNRAANVPRPLYDVFDGRGRLVRQVELPAGRQLVGTGKRAVYAVRVDDVGLSWLERYDR